MSIENEICKKCECLILDNGCYCEIGNEDISISIRLAKEMIDLIHNEYPESCFPDGMAELDNMIDEIDAIKQSLKGRA